MDKKLLFNPNGNDEEKLLIKGNTTNIFDLYNIKYKWATTLWSKMVSQHWLPEKVSMVDDKLSYKQMTASEQEAYLKILSFLIFLDSIQTNNIPHIADYITAPEVVLSLSRQQFDECLTPDTLVLTEDRGWVKLDTVSINDRILSCDMDLNAKFSEITKLSEYDYNGELYEINSDYVSKIVTPKHRILYKDKDSGKSDVTFAKDFYKYKENKYIPSNIKTFTSEYIQTTFTNDEILYALIITCGYITKDDNDGFNVTIKVKTNSDLGRIEYLLDRAVKDHNITYAKVNEKKDGYYYIYLSIPENSSLKLSLNYNELIKLNTFNKEKAIKYLNLISEWIDVKKYGHTFDEMEAHISITFEEYEKALYTSQIAVIAGYTTHMEILDYLNKYDEYCIKYILYYQTCNIINDRLLKNKQIIPDIKLIRYQGKVYCPTVEGSFFVCMRNSKVFITGNSVHSKSYGHILTSIFDKETAEKAMYYWKDDPILLERNSYIANIYQKFLDNPSEERFVEVVVANYLLEGLYFYNGFNFFYNLSSRGFMTNTANQIQYINKDELCHCELFVNIIKTLFKEEPELMNKMTDKIYEMFKTAVEQEIKFSTHCIQNILGITDESIIQYTHYMANRRLKDIGLKEIFEKTKNPYKHLEVLSGIENQTTIKTGNFESTSTSYVQANMFKDWDNL